MKSLQQYKWLVLISAVLAYQILPIIVHAGSRNSKMRSTTVEHIAEKKYSISVNYYSIQYNIDNMASSGFMANNPTPDHAIAFAQARTSYFAIIKSNTKVTARIELLQHLNYEDNSSTFHYVITNPNTGQTVQIQSNLKGDLVQHRADELMIESWGAEVSLEKQDPAPIFEFNGAPFKIIDYDLVRNEIIKIVEDNKLYKAKTNIFKIESE